MRYRKRSTFNVERILGFAIGVGGSSETPKAFASGQPLFGFEFLRYLRFLL
jgi:hypothetical protein